MDLIDGHFSLKMRPGGKGGLLYDAYAMYIFEIGNYGVSSAAMESEAAHTRGVVMREAKNREDVSSAEGGWLDWLADRGAPGIAHAELRRLVAAAATTAGPRTAGGQP